MRRKPRHGKFASKLWLRKNNKRQAFGNLTRLVYLGIDHVRNIIIDIARLSEHSVVTAIDSYAKGISSKKTIFEWSEQLRVLQDEVGDLAIELIACYQPVATDLRFIRSCMEIAYGFSRFGRYAYDIVDVLETMGSISECDKSAVLEMAKTARGDDTHERGDTSIQGQKCCRKAVPDGQHCGCALQKVFA